VQRQLKPGNRLYSFGVGSSPNRFLLNRIAEIGRGTSQIVRQDEPTQEVAEKFFRQINNPVLTNIQINWEGTGEAAVLYPSTPPDLFAEQPLVLFGRKQDRTALKLQITGIAAGGHRYEKTFNLIFEDTGNPAIAQLWGRARIKDLMNQMFGYETKAGVEAVTETALTYQLLSQYTAFVAVSDDVRVDPEGNHISMQVPVEMPEGVSYEGIFANAKLGGVTRGAKARRSLAMPPAQSVDQSRSVIFESFTSLAETGSSYPSSLADEFDITLISPGMIGDAEEVLSAPTPKPSHSPVQVVSATGLDEAAVANLTQHLQQLNLPSGYSGEIVFEFPVRKGRVVRVVLDEDASTLLELQVIEIIKRSLTTWRVPQSATGTVRLTLRIQS
jgi:Ca-activated chloride channel family protein